MIDKTPSSPEYCLILLSSALEFASNKKITMNNLIIDAANEKIFLMLIKNKNIYSVSHENSKTNYEKLSILINDFLYDYDLKINKISKLYVNRGPGSFAGIRNSLRRLSRRCTKVTFEAKFVRNNASSTAVLPPPTTNTSLLR